MTPPEQFSSPASGSGRRNAARALMGIALATGVACTTPASSVGEPADLKEYVDTLTRTGMTEYAAIYLRMVASLRVGQYAMRFGKFETTGRYYLTSAAESPPPGADTKKLEERKAQLHEEAERDVQLLKTQADADGSGFVTTAEAKDYQSLLEFGYLAAHVAEVEGRSDAETISNGAGYYSPEEVPARVKEYNRAAKKLNEASGYAKMPLVPSEP